MANNAMISKPAEKLFIENNLFCSSDFQHLGVSRQTTEAIASSIIHSFPFSAGGASYSGDIAPADAKELEAAGEVWKVNYSIEAETIVVYVNQ